VCFLHCTRGRGCNAHPAFPAPSVLIEGKRSGINPGRFLPRECEGMIFVAKTFIEMSAALFEI
jgi:hypothetical protein